MAMSEPQPGAYHEPPGIDGAVGKVEGGRGAERALDVLVGIEVQEVEAVDRQSNLDSMGDRDVLGEPRIEVVKGGEPAVVASFHGEDLRREVREVADPQESRSVRSGVVVVVDADQKVLRQAID